MQVRRIDSSDKNVAKYVFEFPKAIAESVLYKYPTYKDRTVICCSTQSGCPVGCRFCGAGDNFVRNLTSAEIVSQPKRLIDDTGVSPDEMEKLQIMFMSMGEPMLNWLNLEVALRDLHMKYPNARLLISTIGPRVSYERLMDLSVEIPTIGLQFSVHESTDGERAKLIPYPRKLKLAEIAVVGNHWHSRTGRRPFFNYCVHEGNGTGYDVERLGFLFDPSIWEATISVICERDEHIAAANARQRDLASGFMEKMVRAGYSTRMFDPAGQDDIGGGCGQLWFVQDWMAKNPGLASPSCGAGKPKVHTPSSPAV